MSLHINRFIDAVKAAETRGQKDLVMSLRDAKDLHSDVTKLLLAMEQLRQNVQQSQEVVQIELTGGSFKSA